MPIYKTIIFSFLTLAISGACRGLTTLPLPLATIITAIVIAGFVFAPRSKSPQIDPFHRSEPLKNRISELGFLIATSAMFFFALYHPGFHGLVSVGGGDAGNHVYYKNIFVTSASDVNQGFVSFYGLVYWLERLFDLNDFSAIRAGFYLTIFALLSIFTALITTLSASEGPVSRSRLPIIFLLVLLLGFVPAYRIVLPILHYLQADGFFPQFFGLLPLFLTWYLYVHSRHSLAVVLTLFSGALWYRYTYGLNLGDLLLAICLLTLLALIRLIKAEAPLITKNRRDKILLFGCTSASFLAALFCYLKLSTVISLPGATIKTDLPTALAGIILMSLSLLASVDISQSEERKKALTFGAAIGIASCAPLMLFLHYADAPNYYLYKYLLHAAVLVTCAVLINSAFTLLQCIVEFKARSFTRPVIILLLSFSGLWSLKESYLSYSPAFRERIKHQVKNELISPLVDLKAWEIIDSKLKSSGKKMGGYVTSSWPVSNFMNSAFGLHGEYPFYKDAKVIVLPGYCSFWESGVAEIHQFETQLPKAVIKKVSQLSKTTGVERVDYLSAETGESKQLSFKCFD